MTFTNYSYQNGRLSAESSLNTSSSLNHPGVGVHSTSLSATNSQPRATSGIIQRMSKKALDRPTSFYDYGLSQGEKSINSEKPTDTTRNPRLLEDAPMDLRVAIQQSLETMKELHTRPSHTAYSPQPTRRVHHGTHEENQQAVSSQTSMPQRSITMSRASTNTYSTAKRKEFEQRVLRLMEKRYDSTERLVDEKAKRPEQHYSEQTKNTLCTATSSSFSSSLKKTPPSSSSKHTQTKPLPSNEDEKEKAALVEVSLSTPKKEWICLIEQTLLAELGIQDMTTLHQSIHAWRDRSRLLTQVRSFVDGVEDIVWNTPWIPISSVCDIAQEERHIAIHPQESMCESHASRYRMAVLANEREKTAVMGSVAYSKERLDATFVRLSHWAHSLRQA
ncbi:hypothetical protein BDF14DRAFT_1756152 [Spinellus fusiger]|nr:hypothetical protein BDF14DRAFT_1756152 [Spinellus fusiger]